MNRIKVRARPGFEPGTSRTLSENHTPRPTSQQDVTLEQTDRHIMKRVFNGSSFLPLLSGGGVYNSCPIVKIASAGNRTRINCLEGSYADHYTTDARVLYLE